MTLTKELEATVWGRKFTLSVEYDCYREESVTKNQIKAVETFIAHPEWISDSRILIEEYCKNAVFADGSNKKKDDIFSYIKPDYIFVKRDDKKPSVAMICKYRYDPEHGLAVMYSIDGKISVGNQELLL